MPSQGLITGADGKSRCWWAGHDPLYQAYHDHEWGRPQSDDRALFEKLCLEGFQAGLSWITILKRREHFRKAFKNFDIETVAAFSAEDVKRLLNNDGIIRHRGKIEAAVNNAGCVIKMWEDRISLSAHLWRYQPGPASRPQRHDYPSLKTITQTSESLALAKDLRKRGFQFLGPTTLYAMMQAVGMVNDHVDGCHVRAVVQKQQDNFTPPGPSGKVRAGKGTRK